MVRVLRVDVDEGPLPITVPFYIPISSDIILVLVVESYVVYDTCGFDWGTCPPLVPLAGSISVGTPPCNKPSPVSLMGFSCALA